jgi:alpha/beta superfamily hydrolase
MKLSLGVLMLFFGASSLASGAPPLPVAPTLAEHPGSKVYDHQFTEKSVTCLGRSVAVFLPAKNSPTEVFPTVVYGHGQALDLEAYRGTFEHLAKKGIAVLFPKYDNGFFDQDWTRMGSDYVAMTDCAIRAIGPELLASEVVFSGHSKGAYVASVAAGLSFQRSLAIQPKTLLLFEPAGVDSNTIGFVPTGVSTIVTFADADRTVDRSISEQIFNSVKSATKRFILVKSYRNETSQSLIADHFFPLTKSTFAGGGPEGPLHYYGAWKWLVAAARDLHAGGTFTDSYLYGVDAGDKGVAGFFDDIQY